MKLFMFIGLMAFAVAADQPRKLDHEHFVDFFYVIQEEVGDEIILICEQYSRFEEFRKSLDFLATRHGNRLIYELRSLPEFKDVVRFLEYEKIDVMFLVKIFNRNVMDRLISLVKMRPQIRPTDLWMRRRDNDTRHTASGTDFSSFIRDTINIFPKERLAAIFEQKKEEDEGFRQTMESLKSKQFERIFMDLWKSQAFLMKAQMLANHGIRVDVLVKGIVAVFGQDAQVIALVGNLAPSQLTFWQ